MKLRIYTDGACRGNQSSSNSGGWGAILEFGEHVKELSGGEPDTTNNRMELTAAIEALKALKKEGLDIELFSDSSYLVNCFRDGWYRSWERNGWKTSKKEPVDNRELWEELLALSGKQRVSWYLVKGHVSLKALEDAEHDSASERKRAAAEKKMGELGKLYAQFRNKNGDGFTFEDFIHITEMNNRADALANLGIDEL